MSDTCAELPRRRARTASIEPARTARRCAARVSRTAGRLAGRAALVSGALVAVPAVPAALHAQERGTPERGTPERGTEERGGSVREALGIDRLQLSSVGAWGAWVKPADIEPTESVGVQADYGEPVPGWRIVVGVSYWKSRYEPGVVQRFADSLRAVVNDPTGDATVEVGRVSVSVLAATAEARWSPLRGRQRWRPYLGAGIGAYAQNAEGRPVSGTFIEDALDNIAAGIAASAGADVLLLPNLSFGMQARYDILSGSRFASLRAGASYVFRSRSGA